MTTSKKYDVEVAFDTPEAKQFCDWLNENGHSAKIGNSTGNYINGHCTGNTEEADEIMRVLWDSYCSQ